VRTITDAELRAMRDAVYPAQQETQVQHDSSWEQVKPKWRKDIEWLTSEFEKIKAKEKT